MDTRLAFDLLQTAHRDGATLEALPDGARPASRAEGYAVQGHLDEVAPTIAWKIAASSAAGQRHIGVSGPLAGRITEADLLVPGTPVPVRRNTMRLAELEFAFRMGRDFAPRAEAYPLEEVLDGVAELLLSWEIPSTRYASVATAGEAQLLADRACAHQLLLAPAADQEWRGADLAAAQVQAVNQTTGVTHPGRGGNALEDPRLALAWLVEELRGLGVTLRAGQVVTTGVTTEPLPFGPGDTLAGDWGRFGTLSVTFANDEEEQR